MQTVSTAPLSDRNSGVNNAAMTAPPIHGSILSALAALYATMIGRKYSTERHMVSQNTQVAPAASRRSTPWNGTMPSASRTAAIAMISEEPSSTPSSGRNELERYSKNASSQATLPRTLARSASLTSASLGAALAPAIDGRWVMSA